MPQAGPATRDHHARGAGPRPAPHHLPQAEGGSHSRSRRTTATQGQGRTHTPPQRQPAHPGLTLPKLTAPTSYTINPDRARNAKLAHDLLKHQVINPDDLDLDQAIPDAIARALAKAITPKSGSRLSLEAHLQRDTTGGLRLYLIPDLQAKAFLNAHALTQQLDRLDANLAPSLFALIDRAHALTPCFTPSAAYAAVINLHWHGDESGEEAIEELRYHLAGERDCKPEEIPDAEVKALANEQFLTPDVLEPRLPRRYYHANSETITTPEILARLDTHLFPGALGDLQQLIQVATQASEHASNVLHHDLSDWEEVDYHYETQPWYSYMLSITDPSLLEGPDGNEFNDAVYEMLHEYDQYVMQGSMEPGPSGAYHIPHTPKGIKALADLTQKLRRQLALEARLYDLLAALATNASASEAERSNRP